MSRIPGVCTACQRLSLFSARGLGEIPDCPRCGGSLRAVPGCSFAEGDLALFQELSDVVAELAPLDANRLAIEVERALWSGALSNTFEALSVRWPALTPLVLVTGSNHARQRHILRHLKTIFDGLASLRPREAFVADPPSGVPLAVGQTKP
jgi:hypothetical protein